MRGRRAAGWPQSSLRLSWGSDTAAVLGPLPTNRSPLNLCFYSARVVNLLGSILPGVRDLRTPTAVGALWAAFIYLVAGSAWPSVSGGPYVSRLVTAFRDLPDAYAIGAAGIGVYLLGAACIPIQNYVLTRALRLSKRKLRPVAKRVANSSTTVLRPLIRFGWRLRGTFSEESGAAGGLLYSAIASKLGAVGAPPSIAFLFPTDTFIYRLEGVASQLQINAPGQAQEFDRLNSESEFRRGVAVPLAGLLGLLGWDVAPWLLLPALVLPVVLLGQSFRRQRAAIDVLANSVYLDQLKLPALERWIQVLGAAHPPVGAPFGAWVAAGCTAWRSTEDEWLSGGMATLFYERYGEDAEEVEAFRQYIQEQAPAHHDLLAEPRHSPFP